MHPFTLDQKRYLEDGILNALMPILVAIKHGEVDRARKGAARIEQVIKELPVYLCEHQFHAKNIRTIYGEEIAGLVCVRKRRICPYNKETVSLCDKEVVLECEGAACNLK